MERKYFHGTSAFRWIIVLQKDEGYPLAKKMAVLKEFLKTFMITDRQMEGKDTRRCIRGIKNNKLSKTDSKLMGNWTMGPRQLFKKMQLKVKFD